MNNGDKLETAQQIINHESQRTTKPTVGARAEISLDEMERIAL